MPTSIAPAVVPRLIKALLLLAALHAPAVRALGVEVQAPEEIEALLREHLETARAARLGEKPDAEEIARLQRKSEETARDLLATEGYFSPRVESVVTPVGDDWRVSYRVDPGPRTTVRRAVLRFEGALARNEARGLRARLTRAFAGNAGKPFRQAEWEAAKLAVLRLLLANAYLAARIAASEARVDPAARAADLSVTIDSGPAFHYGAPVVSGTARYPESIVRNLNPGAPGKPVRQQDLLDYQMALEASGYFAQATVRVEPDRARAAAVPIEVTVVERPLKRFSVGAGASTDTGAREQAAWLHRDILDRGMRLRLDTRLETMRQSGLAELTWPRNTKRYEHSLGLQLRQEDIEGQETHATVLAARRNLLRGRIETNLTLQYQTETQTVGDTPVVRNQALTANYVWTQRVTGRAFYPRRGYVLTLQGGGASEALLSDTSFVRLYGRHTHYLPAGDRGRLVLRGEFGSVLADTRDGIPTDFLFRAGGDNSVRGYAYQSLGEAVDGGVASVRYLATGSVEYDYFFTRNWGAAVFVDAGDAADSAAALSPVFGYGVGARYRSPVGPVNVDIAYGEATDEVRLHFSLGVSF